MIPEHPPCLCASPAPFPARPGIEIRSQMTGHFCLGNERCTINTLYFDGHVENIASDTAWAHRQALSDNSSESFFNIFQ